MASISLIPRNVQMRSIGDGVKVRDALDFPWWFPLPLPRCKEGGRQLTPAGPGTRETKLLSYPLVSIGLFALIPG